jgi:hypothetical protein
VHRLWTVSESITVLPGHDARVARWTSPRVILSIQINSGAEQVNLNFAATEDMEMGR